MKTRAIEFRHAMAVGLALGLLLSGGLARAQSRQAAAPPQSPLRDSGHHATSTDHTADPTHLAKAEKGKKKRPEYKPPRRGTPTKRIGGGTRGNGHVQPIVVAVAPDHTGRTMHAQPDLYWFIEEVQHPTTVIFTLLRDDQTLPAVETEIAFPSTPGFQKIRLSDHGVTLDPCHEYQWSIALVPDPEHRSKDVVAMGLIQRVTGAGGKARDRDRAVFAFAEAGLWYDAFMVVAEEVERAPKQDMWRGYRRTLLEQIGLGSATKVSGAPAPSSAG